MEDNAGLTGLGKSSNPAPVSLLVQTPLSCITASGYSSTPEAARLPGYRMLNPLLSEGVCWTSRGRASGTTSLMSKVHGEEKKAREAA